MQSAKTTGTKRQRRKPVRNSDVASVGRPRRPATAGRPTRPKTTFIAGITAGNGSKFKDKTREELLKLLHELVDELKHYESDFITDSGTVTEGDDPTERMLQQVRWGTMNHLNRRVREVNAALERLSEGGFGVCRDCGSQIGHARLSANPTATRCLACQSKYERGRR